MESRTRTVVRVALTLLALVTALAAQRPPGPGSDPFRVVAAMDVAPSVEDGVRLVVRDGDGAPVEGADVVVLQSAALRSPEGRRVVNDPALARFTVDFTARMFAVAAALGTRYRTDAEGGTAVAVEGSARAFVALRHTVESIVLTERAKDREIEVVIEPEPAIEVVVKNSRGRPARGVPVMVVDSDAQYLFQLFQAPVETDRDGRVWIPVPREGERKDLVLAIASRRAPRVPLDPAKPRVELALPPCGQLRVYVEGEGLAGGRRVSGGKVTLGSVGYDWRGMRSISAEEIGDDFVTFRWVGVEEPVEVSVEVDGDAAGRTLQTTGPSLPGEMKVVRLEGVTASIERTCRLIGLDGEPIPSQTLLWTVARPGDIHLTTRRTDLAGTLSFEITPRNQADDVVVTLVLRDHDGTPRGAVRWPMPELMAAETDMGDVRLQEEPVLVAGRVVGPDGSPQPGVTVRAIAEYEIPSDHGSSTSSSGIGERYAYQSAETDAEGRFTLREMNPARPGVTLFVETDATMRVKSALDFAVGTTDAVLELERAARLEGTFAPFPNEVRFDGTVRLVASDGTIQPLDLERNGPRFDTDGLPPGTYALEVLLWGSEEAVHRIDGLALEAGQVVRDPRLDPLDWSAFMKPVRVKVTDSDGQPLQGVTVRHVVRRGRGSSSHGANRIGDGEFVVWVADAGAEVHVQHGDFRTQSFDALKDDRVVALKPRPRLQLTVPNAPELPAWMSLNVRTTPAGGAAGGIQYTMYSSHTVLPGVPQLVRPDLEGKAQLQLDVSIDWEVQQKIRAAGARVSARFTRDIDVKGGPEVQELTVTLTDGELATLQEIVTVVGEILDR